MHLHYVWRCVMSNGYEIARARDALHTISPDVPRETWVKVGMAFHAIGGSFDDFDRWSADGATYKSKDCLATWRSFNARKGIGAGTLFAIARDHGYGKSTRHQPSPVTRPLNAPVKLQMGMDATEVWQRCQPATNAHPYIIGKRAAGVPLNAIRVLPAGDSLRIADETMTGALVVPIFRTDGTLSSLQFITPPDIAERLKAKGKPDKLNLPGASIQGWHVVGELSPVGVIYICEGIGTAWACWQATGDAAVVCFGWGRVASVAAQLRELHPGARLVMVPDVGKEEDAAKVATDVSGLVAAMPDGWDKNSDVNDLGQRDGMDVVASLLEAATEPSKPPPMLKPVSVGDVLTNPAPPPQFVWDGYLPRGVVSLLGAHGGTGKSTIALMLGVCAALGRPLFGIDTMQSKTLFVSLEDGAPIVRNRLAHLCRTWGIDPVQLDGRLQIVDGTENPELFSAESRDAGETTPTYFELRKLVQTEGVGLVVVDNASDAYGGDEIQRRQVRAFIRKLVEIARLTNCAVLLLAHVDKTTSRGLKAAGGEGYSGSTAWHNSVRSRLFMTRSETGNLLLEHQKSNLGRCRDPLMLEWPNGGLPQLVDNEITSGPLNQFMQRSDGRADDELAIQILRMIAEFESRGQFCSPYPSAHTNVYNVLKSERAFQRLKLTGGDCKRIVNQCQRAKWIEHLVYRTHDRKDRLRWALTDTGKAIAGLTAPSAPCLPSANESAESAGGAPSAPSCVGGVGEGSAHFGEMADKEPEIVEVNNGI
jgi:putative DNA primase/helicase